MPSCCSSRFWICVGAIMGALSVGLGAMAAHGLDDILLKNYAGKTHTILETTVPSAQKYLGDFKTAAEYQMYHALALIFVGVLAGRTPSRTLTFAGWSFLIGILLFSGSLYVLVLTGTRWLGAITPIGGLAFMLGWGALAFFASCRSAVPSSETHSS
jgi:uncharacterized membrane protein YgdD (TMEM256/DUF423 family)